MKVLAVSHSSVVSMNRQLFMELRQRHGVDIRLMSPVYFLEATTRRRIHFQSGLLADRAYLGRVFWPGGCTMHFYLEGFIRPFREFDPDLVYIEEDPQSLVTAQFLLLSRVFRKPVIVRMVENIDRKYPWPIAAIERFTIARADGFVAFSQDARGLLVKKGWRRAVPVIPHAIDEKQFFPRPEAAALRDRLRLTGFVVGYIGRLDAGKGLFDLIDAVAESRRQRPGSDVHLLIVGDGDIGDAIKQRLDRAGLSDACVMLPAVAHVDVPLHLSCMDLSVLPSLTTLKWKEQFGRTIIESLACGVPVVGSDSGEIPNVIRATGGGMVFPEGSPKDLAGCIVRMIDDPADRARMAETGRRNVSAGYTYTRIAADFHRLFSDIVSERAEAGGCRATMLDR